MAAEPRTTHEDLIAQIAADPAGLLLCSDFDGTLAPIVADPMAARPVPGAVEILGRIAEHIKALAIVTGRDVRTVHQLAGLQSLKDSANVVAVGQYGVERWTASDDRFDIPEQPDAVASAIDEIERLVADDAQFAGVHVEDKKLAVGVHTRRTADPAQTLKALEPSLRKIADKYELHAEPGKFVLELRAEKMSKGEAVANLIDEYQPRAIIFMGDDLGDLAAFDVVEEWRSQGNSGVKIAVASDEQPAVAERADLVFGDQHELVRWLGQLADRLAANADENKE